MGTVTTLRTSVVAGSLCLASYFGWTSVFCFSTMRVIVAYVTTASQQNTVALPPVPASIKGASQWCSSRSGRGCTPATVVPHGLHHMFVI